MVRMIDRSLQRSPSLRMIGHVSVSMALTNQWAGMHHMRPVAVTSIFTLRGYKAEFTSGKIDSQRSFSRRNCSLVKGMDFCIYNRLILFFHSLKVL